jgi:hypothetical protein
MSFPRDTQHTAGILAAVFRRFAEVDSQRMSPFYSLLASAIACDSDLLRAFHLADCEAHGLWIDWRSKAL